MVSSVKELNYVPEMPEKARNIVIIGAGGIVSGSNLPAYRLAGYPVVGIYDLDEEKAKSVAKEFGIANTASTVEELVKITGTISCATRNTGKSAEGKWTPEKAGRGLQRAIPAPQRDKDPPMCLYQP